MGGSVSITGSDVFQVDGRVLNDLANGAVVDFKFPNDIGMAMAGRNGNTLFAKDERGRIGEVEVRLLIGSADDKFLNSRLQQWKLSPSDFKLMTGVFSKRTGDGKSGIATKVYQAAGGIFKKQPEARSNTEGDIEQSVVVYTLTFADVQLSVQ